ncbi:amphi-Trp domain-containing protein [Haladaptatus sp. DFWS20]|uniref:amphi-Trp domain-containing protein n=1 Tax=Haladaptatus sp. DFWS20 TaxID=3403467 RepID=UPI003EC106BD
MAELEAEFEKSRSDIATYLREFADKLDSNGTQHTNASSRTQGANETTSMTDSTDDTSVHQSDANNQEKVTILVGNDSATVNPPETLSFSVAVDSDSSLMDSGAEESVTFTLRWASDDVQEDDELSVH